MVRRAYAGGAVPTTLSVGINNVATAATLVGLTGYPSGSSKWYACFDRGTVNEEKVLVTQVSGFIVTITRGVDGTTAVAHSAGATFEHIITAVDLDEANDHVNSTGNKHGLGVGVNFVGDTTVQALTGKTMDGDLNTFLDIPQASVAGLPASITALTTSINTKSPIGMVVPFAGDAAPTGWLLCDGTTFSNVTYPALATLLADKYGVHSGVNYYLPDLRGRMVVGRDAAQAEFDTLNDFGGSKTKTLVVGEMPSHNHGGATVATSISHQHDLNHDHGSFTTAVGGGHPHAADMDIIASGTHGHSAVGGAAGTSGAASDPGTYGVVQATGSDHQHTIDVPALGAGQNSGFADPSHAHTINSQGSGTTYDSMNPFRVLNYIILAV